MARMKILLTVGTHYKGFDRLLIEFEKAIEKIIDLWHFKPFFIIIQGGNSFYRPKYFDIYFKFADEETFIKLIKISDMIISHAGVGIITSSILYKKPIAIMPRLEKYSEAIDNHQIEISKIMSMKSCAHIINNYGDIVNFLTSYPKNRQVCHINYFFYKMLDKLIIEKLGVKNEENKL